MNLVQNNPKITKYLSYICQKYVTKNFQKLPNLVTLFLIDHLFMKGT